MRRFLNLICVVFVAFTIAAAQTHATKPASEGHKPVAAPADTLPSEATVDSFLQQQFGYETEMTWKISSIKPSPIAGVAEVVVVLASPQGQQVTHFFVGADGKHALVGDIIPFGPRPFDPVNKTLEKGITGPSRGPKNSPVLIVEFGDLQCPACKRAQDPIEKLVAAEPQARFVFQNFPLEMHNWAMKGALYSDCVGRASSEDFWKFISKVYETQSDITAENADEKLTAIAVDAGLQGPEITACVAKPETKAHVDASIALGKSVGVTGTPTLFINGRPISNFQPELLEIYKKLVEFAEKNP